MARKTKVITASNTGMTPTTNIAWHHRLATIGFRDSSSTGIGGAYGLSVLSSVMAFSLALTGRFNGGHDVNSKPV